MDIETPIGMSFKFATPHFLQNIETYHDTNTTTSPILEEEYLSIVQKEIKNPYRVWTTGYFQTGRIAPISRLHTQNLETITFKLTW